VITLETHSREVRHAVARVIARYLLLHLDEEKHKPATLQYGDSPDLPLRPMMEALAKQVRDEFELTDADLPADNIFRSWYEINNRFSYDEVAVPGYDQIFLSRLLDLRDGTHESQDLLLGTMRKVIEGFHYEERGYSPSFFLNSESVMRELMRERVRRALPQLEEDADRLVLSQSGWLQTFMYEYFESVLRKTLAENVRLLHQILPDPIARELKLKGSVEPVHFKDSAVLFTDFEDFSQSTEHLPPAEVIRRLGTYFTEFDKICERHGLEKIKTIGDSYMAVAGVPELHNDPVHAACDAALEIREASARISTQFGPGGWNIRIGIHAGPLVAGVIGTNKFSYDVWGATVNFASRMESSGAPGMINVSSEVHRRVEANYLWQPRGPQAVKKLGTAEMFFLLGNKEGRKGGGGSATLSPSG
jgi:class 3 adenylate cyclase